MPRENETNNRSGSKVMNKFYSASSLAMAILRMNELKHLTYNQKADMFPEIMARIDDFFDVTMSRDDWYALCEYSRAEFYREYGDGKVKH